MNWRWRLAIVFWLAGLTVLVLPESAQAAVEIGEVRFGIGYVALIFAAGLAWGDARRGQQETRNELSRLREETRREVNELRREIEHMRGPRG